MSQNDPQYDRRVQQWNLRKGLMTEEQLREHLKKLPDVKDKSDHLGSPPSTEKPGEGSGGKSRSR